MESLNLSNLLNAFIAFIALVNPIQKVFIVIAIQERFDKESIASISIRSTITALIILILFLFIGEYIFNYIFRIEIYAFQITSGIVLFYNGIMGLQKGEFIRLDKNVSMQDIIAVPIAIPMIAGPATITAAVTFPIQFGKTVTTISIIIAVFINLMAMLNASKIEKYLNRFNLMNPLIRIFGLIVATIGIQMILNGIKTFVDTMRP